MQTRRWARRSGIVGEEGETPDLCILSLTIADREASSMILMWNEVAAGERSSLEYKETS